MGQHNRKCEICEKLFVVDDHHTGFTCSPECRAVLLRKRKEAQAAYSRKKYRRRVGTQSTPSVSEITEIMHRYRISA